MVVLRRQRGQQRLVSQRVDADFVMARRRRRLDHGRSREPAGRDEPQKLRRHVLMEPKLQGRVRPSSRSSSRIAPGERRSRHMQTLGGASEVQLLGHRDEVPQLTQLYRNIHPADTGLAAVPAPGLQ
jgi:hypothetical protein